MMPFIFLLQGQRLYCGRGGGLSTESDRKNSRSRKIVEKPGRLSRQYPEDGQAPLRH